MSIGVASPPPPTRDKTNKEVQWHKDHFAERLKERYGIILERGKNIGKYHGCFSKNSNKSVGYVFINGIKVWVLYCCEDKTFRTCYPPDVEYDIDSCFKMCFGGPVRGIAQIIYDLYLKEHDRVRTDFSTNKDAWLYYSENALFTPLHMDQYKYGKVEFIKIMQVISSVLTGDSKYMQLGILKKQCQSSQS